MLKIWSMVTELLYLFGISISLMSMLMNGRFRPLYRNKSSNRPKMLKAEVALRRERLLPPSYGCSEVNQSLFLRFDLRVAPRVIPWRLCTWLTDEGSLLSFDAV
jgi:hypothetical protein